MDEYNVVRIEPIDNGFLVTVDMHMRVTKHYAKNVGQVNKLVRKVFGGNEGELFEVDVESDDLITLKV